MTQPITAAAILPTAIVASLFFDRVATLPLYWSGRLAETKPQGNYILAKQ